MPEGSLHGRPSAAELLEAVREFLVDELMPAVDGPLRFHARVAANAVAIVERELALGPAQELEHGAALARLGVASEVELAAAIRDGGLDDRLDEVLEAVRATVRARLDVANPGY